MRQDYEGFVARNAVVVVAGPEGPRQFKAYWESEGLPFVGLPDPKHSVLRRYGQEVSLFKLGRMPAQVIVDRAGIARYVHYGKSMSDIPANEELFDLLDKINEPESPAAQSEEPEVNSQARSQ